jgi:hypothetical protein
MSLFDVFFSGLENAAGVAVDMVTPSTNSDSSKSEPERDHHGRTLEDYTREADEKSGSSSTGWFW